MDGDFSLYSRCTCSALFPTVEALDVHLNENKSLEESILTQLEICKGHARANDVVESTDENADESGIQGQDVGLHSCPVRGCKRMVNPFNNRQRLRRHYQQHVKCNEICVCCHRTMQFVRDFIRHAERHQDASKTKLSYIHNMCAELRTRACEELEIMEQSRRSSQPRAAINRTHQSLELDPQACGLKRKRDETEQIGHGTRHPSSDGIPLSDTDYDIWNIFNGNPQDSVAVPMLASDQLSEPIPASFGIDQVTNPLAGTQLDELVPNPIHASGADAVFNEPHLDASVNNTRNGPDLSSMRQV